MKLLFGDLEKEEVAKKLLGQNVKLLLITLGPDGVFYARKGEQFQPFQSLRKSKSF